MLVNQKQSIFPCDPEHQALKRKAYRVPLMDMQYALNNDGIAALFLEPGSDHLQGWLHLLAKGHEMDRLVRKRGSHVEFESESWLSAFNFSIHISAVSQCIFKGFIACGMDLPNLCKLIFRQVFNTASRE